MKFDCDNAAFVAPYMGAWIETICTIWQASAHTVAPYMGAWIETVYLQRPPQSQSVAPYMGAWIETEREISQTELDESRSLHGGVD